MRKTIRHILAAVAALHIAALPAARAAIIQGGTAVNESRANLGESECDIAYAACMDQFCVTDNANAGRCQCSNDFAKHDAAWRKLDEEEVELQNRTARAIEDLEAGARADINRQAEPQQSRAAARQAAALALFNQPETRTQNTGAASNDISAQSGAARLAAADRTCAPTLPANCDINMTRMLYQQSVRSDCRAYELTVEERRNEGIQQQMLANQSVRAAALASFETSNRFNSSECLVQLTECMRGDAVCGRTWSNCFEGRLAQNRDKCEQILDQCVAVRDMVWDNFVTLATPDIEAAQIVANSSIRQSCLMDVSECIARACADTIGTGDEVSYASCMVNPDAIRYRCKVELDRCSGIPGMFDLAARVWRGKQVDGCRDEVRECFQHEDRCGPDWTKCVGLDLAAMHRMCPVERLVVCRQNNPDFSLADIDEIVGTVYLALDNAVLNACNEAVDNKMTEICGGTTWCDRFRNLENLGTESLRRERVSGTDSITGVVSWHLVRMSMGEDWNECMRRGRQNCDRHAKPGTLLVDEYMKEFDQVNRGLPGVAAMRERVKSELETAQRDINTVVRAFETDPNISRCISGRDLSQVTGRAGDRSTGSFPMLTNAYRMIITRAALAQAAENHRAREQRLREAILREADTLTIEFQCHSIPFQMMKSLQDMAAQLEDTEQARQVIPDSVLAISDGPFRTMIPVAKTVTRADIAALAGRKHENEITGRNASMSYEMTTSFNPDTCICQICADITICGSTETKGRIRNAAMGMAAATTVATGIGALAAPGKVGDAATKAITGSASALGTGIAGMAGMTGMAAVPVIGWVALGAMTIKSAYMGLIGVRAQTMEFSCEPEPTKCDDKQMPCKHVVPAAAQSSPIEMLQD